MSTDIFSGTTFDGDTIEYEGQTYRFRTEPDDMPAISWGKNGIGEFDSWECGTFAWAQRRDTGTRPYQFTGLARKLQSNGGDPIWWQPPTDMESATKGGFADVATWQSSLDSMARTILSILEYGYIGVIVDRIDDEGGELDTASLWGIEPDSYGYHSQVAMDLVGELASNVPAAPMTMQYGSAFVTA